MLNNNVNTLCFSGGNIKGFIFIGMVKRCIVDKLINMKNINHFIGVSAGSIISFLLSLNYDIDYIYNFCLLFNFELLYKNNNYIDNLIYKKCFNTTSNFIILFKLFLHKKFNIYDCSFKKLFGLTNKKLSIIGCNLTDSKEEIFNYKTTPNMSVITALKISIAIPGFFNPVYYNYKCYVDGSVLNNYPIKYCNKNLTLGFIIFNKNKKTYPNNIFEIIYKTLNLMMNNSLNKIDFEHNYIMIKIYLPTIIKLNENIIKKLMDIGFKSMKFMDKK